MNKDLTQGKPSEVLLKFSLPLFGSVIFQQLYNIADSLVAGKFISNNALAAVGNSYEITLIFIAFAFGCNIGCSVVCARLFGAKKYSDMKTAVSTSFISIGVLCVLLIFAGCLLCEAMLKVINTPENIFADSRLYLNIYIAGLPFMFYYNVATGIFSAMGDTKTPFLLLVCSSLGNIAADILFVAGFSMGIAGLAWATFICQGVSCVLSLVFLLKRLKKTQPAEKQRLFSLRLLKEIAVVAVPSILQQSFISVGNIVIQSLVNSFGTEVIAGYSAGVKLNNMIITSLTTLGNGISNFTAQNIGAEKYARVSAGFKAGLRMVWAICIPVVLIYMLAGNGLVYIFLDSPNGTAAVTGARFLQILSPFYFVVAAKLASDGVLRGSGRMKQFMAATFADLILRVALAKILSSTALAVAGIWAAWPVGWCVGAALSVFFCKKMKLPHSQ